MKQLPQTERTALRRLPKRGTYDRESIYAILDEALLCHVGFIVEAQPYVIPTGFVRVEDRLFLHGSKASRMLKALKDGVEACVTVTLLDGLVLARSAFHHSMNYRSVVVFGKASSVEDDKGKMAVLRAFSEHMIPNRWDEVREPNQNELNATLVVSLPLDEASAKIRVGPPVDDEEDYALSVWAGVLPLRVMTQEAINDPRLPEEIQLPASVGNYNRANEKP
jgi:nitroimidazol reductase NimA-like FMN-containing flavoprotein (pyridoxamine 5'-phosphate oxidase superfamily)